jgi:hypothetical protein
MQAKDIIPIAVSCSALLVSGAVAYFTVFRGPRLLTELGEVLLIRYFPDGRVSLMPELAMYNEGGRVAVVLQVRES